jgi:hypothetical protein
LKDIFIVKVIYGVNQTNQVLQWYPDFQLQFAKNNKHS